MNCPYCEVEMKKGYLAGLTIVTFSEKYRKVSLHPRKGDIVIALNSGNVAHKASWYCAECETIILKNIPKMHERTQVLYSGEEEDLNFDNGDD